MAPKVIVLCLFVAVVAEKTRKYLPLLPPQCTQALLEDSPRGQKTSELERNAVMTSAVEYTAITGENQKRKIADKVSISQLLTGILPLNPVICALKRMLKGSVCGLWKG